MSSMVVSNLHIPGGTIRPPEANSPLVIDTNAVLPYAIAFQSLQSIAGRDAQLFKIDNSVQYQEFAARLALDA